MQDIIELVNKVYCGDCLEIMKEIPDKSIDMILCDLPYGITACTWDSVIDLEKLWFHYKRLIKDHGAIVLTASQPFTSKLVMSNPTWFKCEWIWEKDNGSNFMLYKYHPSKVHENILIFSKDRVNYFPQMIEGNPYVSLRKGAPINEHYHSGTLRTDTINNTGLRYPRSVLKYNLERGLHPTQKQTALFDYLIKTYSEPGDVVLDNTAGSGTTAIAALNTGRRYILIEQDQKYYEMCCERINNYRKPIIEQAIDYDGLRFCQMIIQ